MYDRTTTPATQPAAGDMRTLIDTLAALGKPQKNPDADGQHYVVAPQGFEVTPLPVEMVPARPRGTVKLRDAASFIGYFNAHKVARSTIYASLEPATFLAVFDDFDHSGAVGDVVDQSDWRGFRALFEVPASREWKLWTNANRKHMAQLAFAEFLQDNLPDVMQPAGAELLEMALNFEAAQSGNFIAAQRLQDGSHNLQWKADNNASGSVRLPEHITLRIPVFENEEPREIVARLRYRVPEGRLAIWFELVRPHKVLEEAFRATWARIESEGQTKVLLGSPE
jgi:uncharacterized protein YfdQ (DUF2303 family)